MIKKSLIALMVFMIILQIVNSITRIEVNETDLVSLKVNAADPDSDALQYSYSEPLNSDGEWQTGYGDAGDYPINVTVSDGESSASQEVELIVFKKEEPPKIDAYTPEEAQLTVDEGKEVIFKVSASDLNKDELSFLWELNGNKVSEEDSYLFLPDYDSDGNYKIKVIVSDAASEISQEWEATVNNIDRSPALAKIDPIYLSENEEKEITINAADPDGDTVTLLSDNLPEFCSITDYALNCKPGYDAVTTKGAVNNLLGKFHMLSKSFSFKLIATSNDNSAEEEVNIIVTDASPPIKLKDIPPITVKEGEAINIQPEAEDSNGENIKYAYSGWLSSDSYKTNYEDAGIYIVRVTASNGGLADSKDVLINVTNVNRPPIFYQIKESSVEENSTIKIELTAADPDNDKATIYSPRLPEGASLKDNIFLWKPDFDAVKNESERFEIEFIATDGETETKQKTAITVFNKNRPPKIIGASDAQITAKANEPVILSVEAEDPDGDELSYIWKFGLFEKYNASSVHQRIFSSPGNKDVQVEVTDGKESVFYKWEIEVE